MPDTAAIQVYEAHDPSTCTCPACGARAPTNGKCPACGTMQGPMAAAATALLKSGNIEQGYASCLIDPMVEAIRKGKCDPRRIQCNIPVSLSATAHAGGTTLVYSITPVGYSVLRRIELQRAVADVAAAPDYRPVVTQISAKGVFTVTAEVTVSPANAGNIPTGFLLSTYSANFQNYTAPSGIPFSESNPLKIAVLNAGVDNGSFSASAFYDGEREG